MDTANGTFWRPESPNQRIPGLLSTTEDGVTTLEVATSITPALEVLSHGAAAGSGVFVPADDPLDFVLHGALSTAPVAVSLIDCWTKNRQTRHTRVGEIESQTIHAGRVVRGAFVSGSAVYKGVRLRVEGIESWAGLPDPWPDRSSNGELVLRFAPVECEPVSLPSGAVLVLDDRIGWRQRVGVETTVQRAPCLQVTGIDGLTYQQVDAQLVTPLVGFLSFALGSTASLTSIELLHEDKWVTMHHVGIYEQDKRSKVGSLLALHDAGIGIAASFLDVYRTVGPAVPVTQDMLSNRRKTTVETQVLELTTVAEGLHRNLYPEQERMPKEDVARIRQVIARALADEREPRYRDIVSGVVLNYLGEPNYKTRLRRLVDDVDEAMPGLFGNVSEWINLVNDARNRFAHRKSGFVTVSEIDELYVVGQSLKWLIWGVILSKAGVSADALRRALADHQPYQFFLRHARATVARVYEE